MLKNEPQRIEYKQKIKPIQKNRHFYDFLDK